LEDFAEASAATSFSEAAEVASQLQTFRIMLSIEEKIPSEVLGQIKDNIKATRSASDEGYEADEEDERGSRDTSAKLPKPSNLPTTFNITHRLDTGPKTQHFSKRLVAFAHNSEKKEAGQIKARYINIPVLKTMMSKGRSTVQSNFYTRLQDLNSGSSDGLAFAKALFCQKGKLKKEHMGDTKKALGPWGRELETSAVLILQLVFIEKEFRRQGLARLLLKSLIETAKERAAKTDNGKVKFVVVFPVVVKDDFEKELEGKTELEKQEIEKFHYGRAVRFYGAMEFRRIGLSK
jgi:GNAT superfamily N-acetyltransferase